MKKVMISQPFNGIGNEKIISTRNKAFRTLTDAGYEVINAGENTEGYGVVKTPICSLAKDLAEHIFMCQAVYFCKGWEKARICKIEHEVAKAYGLEIIYEEE